MSVTVHVALATYPKGKSLEYVKDIETFYKTFKEATLANYNSNSKPNEKIWAELHKPVAYHIFGHYDVAFISLAHSYKFSQRLFFPKFDTGKLDITTNAYQILTGLYQGEANNNSEITLFKDGSDKNFVCISNLKLSNGFLIGNGNIFFNAVVAGLKKKLNEDYKDATCIFIQSFSWFEITLLVFIDSTDKLSQILHTVREFGISDLGNEIDAIICNSLYATYREKEDLKDYHVFADTQSYVGVKLDYFKEGYNKDGSIDYTTEKLQTQIEWQVTPGKLENLLTELNKLAIFKTDKNDIVSLTGKTDYIIPEENNTLLSNNQKLFHFLLKEEEAQDENKTRKSFLNYRTRPLLPFIDGSHSVMLEDTKKVTTEKSTSYTEKLPHPIHKLAFSHEKMANAFKMLREMKVSRHVRQKINKVFFNYNNGIKDPILYIYFLDFHNFINHLNQVIEAEYQKYKVIYGTEKYENETFPRPVSFIEKILESFIIAFQEGYNMRGLNTFFDEIHDYDLDANSACQQLLITYNALVSTIAEKLLSRDGTGPTQVVQLNLQHTVSNDLSINYNVYHLWSPEFIFFTLIKEILNSAMKADNEISKLSKNLKLSLKKSNSKLIQSWSAEKIIDADYYVIDTLRVVLTCNFDLALFEWMFNVFNLQNTSLYSSKGIMEEIHFRQELFRLIFTVSLFDENQVDKLKCPTEELASYWNRYFYPVKKAVETFMEEYYDEKDLTNRAFFSREVVLSFRGIFEGLSQENLKTHLLTSELNISIFKDYNCNEHGQVLITRDSIREWMKYLEDFKTNYDSCHDTPMIYDENTHKNTFSFLSGLMYSYLKTIKDDNEGSISLLRRNAQSSDVLNIFTGDGKEAFLIDPSGGLFFTDFAKKEKYYNRRNAILKTLWHFSLVIKKTSIQH